MIYDVIGDVHGQADKLIGLLTKLGYQHNGEFFQPPKNHCAIFVGDLIDRGHQELQTLQIVFAMLDAGVAYAVMGNHEYNALAYATLNEKNPNEYLRSHKHHHYQQHKAFLLEVPFGSDEHLFWLQRFYELPLWLELDDLCVVHACWDSQSMSVLQPLLTDKQCLTPNALQLTGQKGTLEYDALERVLKGVEAPLPDGMFMLDKDGAKRRAIRIAWWQDNLSNQPIHEVAKAPSDSLAQIPYGTLSGDIDFSLTTQKPIFIGHYWFSGTPKPLSSQVVCTDYSAAIDVGFLTAYQFDSDNPSLSADNFVQYFHR